VRKLFTATAICLAMFFTACNNPAGNPADSNGGPRTTLQINNQSGRELSRVTFQNVIFARENADVIGTWIWTEGEGWGNLTLTLNITDTAWTGSAHMHGGHTFIGNGQWSRNGNAVTFNNNEDHGLMDGFGTLIGNKLTVNFRLTSPLHTTVARSFETTSDNLQMGISPGNTVLKDVPAGSSFIFFEVNSVRYSTRDFVVVEENGSVMFTFTNNTLVVEVATGNLFTLGSL